ncbi:MAG: NUDIX domain-containing protein [Clostridia bacterium]|nr:NUDIX domain-containing protein [Clostridia bacterium]
MEKWDILNSAGEPTGETVERSANALKEGQFHLVIHVWVINGKKKTLIQKRSDKVDILPGMWAATSGSALSGETELDAAKRELSEELGIKAKDDELILIKKYRGRNNFVYVYAVHKNVGISEITMQEEEVQAVKWVTSKELSDMVHKKQFHHYNYMTELYEYMNK